MRCTAAPMAGRAPARCSRPPSCATCTTTARKPEQVAMVKDVHSGHASNNPKAFYKKRYTVDDVINSRIICKPLHLLDCCVETDNAHVHHRHLGRTCARSAPHAGADPRRGRPLQQAAHRHALSARADLDASPATTPRTSCGRTPASGRRISTLTGAYDAFTFTTMLQLEDYGFCKKGEGGEYVSNGTIQAGRQAAATTPPAAICARATRTA